MKEDTEGTKRREKKRKRKRKENAKRDKTHEANRLEVSRGRSDRTGQINSTPKNIVKALAAYPKLLPVCYKCFTACYMVQQNYLALRVPNLPKHPEGCIQASTALGYAPFALSAM